MQANQGKVEVQAQNDELQLNALKDATLTSSAGKITIAAKEEILITCKGAYIKLSNGEVEIGSPKVVRVRAPLVVNGSHQIKYPLPFFAGSFSGAFTIKDDKTGEVIPNQKYLLTLPDGQTILGVTNTQGKTITAYSGSPEQIKLELLEDDEIWYREEETFELEVINNEENLILPYENNESEDKK